jgi:hypothetical protein
VLGDMIRTTKSDGNGWRRRQEFPHVTDLTDNITQIIVVAKVADEAPRRSTGARHPLRRGDRAHGLTSAWWPTR